jgi:predicted amidohydrolase
MDAMTSFTAAVVQAVAVGFDVEPGLEKVGRLAGEVSASGAALAVFPEAFLPGVERHAGW